jgi:hypothetical protein
VGSGVGWWEGWKGEEVAVRMESGVKGGGESREGAKVCGSRQMNRGTW